ncbi:thiamine pyrophosphate-dependent enzyme [Falsiroseomonas sp. HW251]|uniref:thiamine pyrophosphate-dependent enzyme n=1 Tax=Falsiroseomonas sp. HW251 TaxID=3390998 RepID=UPI003D314A91
MPGTIDRRDVVRGLLADRGDLLVAAGLGASAWDITAAGDRAENLPLWGGMGGAAMLGLGLALAQPKRRVLVITGDGEMLMGLGALCTIAVTKPANLAVVVLDNEHYSETGGQETATRHGVDLAAMARGAGIADARVVTEMGGVERLRADIHAASAPLFAVVKVAPGNHPLVLPPREGAHLTARFRETVLGPSAHHQL